MNRYIYHRNYQIEYHKDISRIVNIFENEGFLLSRNDAYLAWGAYSDDFLLNPGWVSLPENDGEIFNILKEYLKLEQ